MASMIFRLATPQSVCATAGLIRRPALVSSPQYWAYSQFSSQSPPPAPDSSVVAPPLPPAPPTETIETASVKLPEGYDPHKPPFSAAWDRTCPSWRSIDRDNGLVSNWHNPDDPDDLSRITITKTSFTDYKKMSFGRMHDRVKVEMYNKYSSDPVTWTVAKLATAYGVNQPRVQAILLLKEWEKQDRALGLVTEEDDRLEDQVHAAHIRTVKRLEAETGATIDPESYREHPTKLAGGPLGKVRILRDEDKVPEKPDPEHHIKWQEAAYTRRANELKAQQAAHKKVSNKRWTFVIKDSSAPNVQ